MILYDYIFSRDGGIASVFLDKRKHDVMYYKWRDGAKKKLRKEKCEEFDLSGLKGYYYSAGRKPSGKIAFIVHGHRSNHLETAGVWREFYKKRGIDIFCPDNPAAGNSCGDYVGYGYFESKACLDWIDFLKEKFGNDIKIIIHGFSLGGAAALDMSDTVPGNVKFIIDDCGFTGGNDLLKIKLGRFYEFIRKINLKKAGYDLKDTDVRPHLRGAKVPILFVHGVKDSTVPFRMGLENYVNCRTDKDCLFVDDAIHMESYYLEKDRYEEKIGKFIEKYLS